MLFCVEDDDDIRELMLYALSAAGFEAEGFPDGAELMRTLDGCVPELIMLDLMLPGEDGLSVLRRLRADPATASVPVIIATAKGAEYDKVTGLDLGADDYLVKPFGMMEMVSRVRAVLRRSAPKRDIRVLRAGGITLNDDAHSVTADGRSIRLTLKEYELLRIFIENIDVAMSREKLLRLVWGDEFMGETRTVDVHIGTLRTKLGGCGAMIETVRGVGYKMKRGGGDIL